MGKLKDKVAIITGGAGGIGRGMAMAFVKEGAKVVIVDLDEVAGNKVEKELQEYVADSMFIQQDLTEHDKLADVVKQIGDKYGRIDVLVNNAHASRMGSFEETTQADMDFRLVQDFIQRFTLCKQHYLI